MLRLLACNLCCIAALSAAAELAPTLPPGGANAPQASEPWPLVGEQQELPLGPGRFLRVPAATYRAPAGGAAAYRSPAPIIAIGLAAADDAAPQWYGHGYLETYAALLSYECRLQRDDATWNLQIVYRFDDESSYTATLQADTTTGSLQLTEESGLGVRDRWIFDAGYGWRAQAAILLDGQGRATGRYLPCHYDERSASLAPPFDQGPALLAVLSPHPERPPVLACWQRRGTDWQQAARGAVELWQRRQLPDDPGSRHFLGPETKSDGTPNPFTATMIGTSRYEGHVTLEFGLGCRSRHLGFAIHRRPADNAALMAELAEHLDD